MSPGDPQARARAPSHLDARDGIGYHLQWKWCPGFRLSPQPAAPSLHGERSQCTRPRRFAPRSAAG